MFFREKCQYLLENSQLRNEIAKFKHENHNTGGDGITDDDELR